MMIEGAIFLHALFNPNNQIINPKIYFLKLKLFINLIKYIF
jgi:hypothetical protein